MCAKEMEPPKSGVKVRMYRHGFGDCFLLAFPGDDGAPRYMLIDCGLHHCVNDHVKKIRRVVRDIKQATGNHIHVLVVTHEHTDHISGFQHAMDIFKDKKLKIDEVWLSWAEDLKDPVTRRLRRKYDKQLAAVERALTLDAWGDGARADAIRALPSFSGLLGAGSGSLTTSKAMSKIKRLGKRTYCKPEDPPRKIPGVSGAKVYVLGPPRDLDLIKKDSQKNALYMEGTGAGQRLAFLSAVMSKPSAAGRPRHRDAELERRCTPFERNYQRSLGNQKVSRFLDRTYNDSGQAWRRIDSAWLEQAGDLALHLESHRNNTSFALAIELDRTQDVLLFPGDAQYGNWLSWQDLQWGEGDDKVTGQDLLKRTVLYKVGHHGSHNATLKKEGLEQMTDPDLAAMIPVDRAFAATQGDKDANGKPKGWEMPYKKLYERLEQKTKGRILQADLPVPGASKTALEEDEQTVFEAATEGSCDAYLDYMVLDKD